MNHPQPVPVELDRKDGRVSLENNRLMKPGCQVLFMAQRFGEVRNKVKGYLILKNIS